MPKQLTHVAEIIPQILGAQPSLFLIRYRLARVEEEEIETTSEFGRGPKLICDGFNAGERWWRRANEENRWERLLLVTWLFAQFLQVRGSFPRESTLTAPQESLPAGCLHPIGFEAQRAV